MIDLEMKEPLFREAYYDKFLALKSILQETVHDLIFDPAYRLENGKVISRIYKELLGVSIHNKNTWGEIYKFFNENMPKLEVVFKEYQDFIQDI